MKLNVLANQSAPPNRRCGFPPRARRQFGHAFPAPPADHETKLLTDYLDQRSDRPTDAVRQLVWALLTSTEFRFDH